MISASFFACSLFSALQEKEKKSYLLLTVIINYILQTVILKYSALELSYTQKQKQSKKKKNSSSIVLSERSVSYSFCFSISTSAKLKAADVLTISHRVLTSVIQDNDETTGYLTETLLIL